MYYIVYKTSNLINGKFYIGTHKTEDLNDNYMGSGKLLLRAIEKYGLENFKKEILHTFDNPEEMFAKEAEIVNADFLAEENTYNLKVGGFGGFDYINENPEKFLTAKRLSNLWNNNQRNERWKLKYESDPTFIKKMNDNLVLARSRFKEKYPDGAFKGKKHSSATIQKMKTSAVGKHNGNKNSQYGTCWITNGLESKKISKLEDIPAGWKKGRTM